MTTTSSAPIGGLLALTRLLALLLTLGSDAATAQTDGLQTLPATTITLSTDTPLAPSETLITVPTDSLSLAPSPSSPDSATDAAPPPPPTTTTLTSVVPVFYVDSGNEYGLPYTILHRDCGSVAGVDATATTLVITATLTDQRTASASPGRTRTDNVTTNIPTLRRTESLHFNRTFWPSTVTQGPSTFLFTGSYYGPNRTLVNRCRLNGTTSATCNLTHVGDGWYTRLDPGWNGTYSTYNYSWTSGDRFGFAPVTLTAGVEKLPAATAKATSSNAAAPGAGRGPPRGLLGEMGGLLCSSAVVGAFVLGIFLVL